MVDEYIPTVGLWPRCHPGQQTSSSRCYCSFQVSLPDSVEKFAKESATARHFVVSRIAVSGSQFQASKVETFWPHPGRS
jgi:hypothetical protein